MRIAVTGSSGGVGRAIVDAALGDGHEVVRIDRALPPEDQADAPFVQCDVADFAALKSAMD